MAEQTKETKTKKASKHEIEGECIFCKIARKEIPSEVVIETENVLAFLDINPISKGHTLIIPKQHFLNMLDLPEHIGIEMLAVSKLVAYSQIKALRAEGFSFLVRNFPVAGQVIMHTHFHVIPRFKSDELKEWPSRKYEEGESKKILGELNSAIEEIKKANKDTAD